MLLAQCGQAEDSTWLVNRTGQRRSLVWCVAGVGVKEVAYIVRRLITYRKYE